ncbi:hypothetical protein N7520_010828 [Penicillium odoratum]|uniref:uncharacterized protein n=1 Tax=Penicillium odoratum TaxID=1167516 RepID=UPI002547A552|nr:uncharacterized protein N7520_010828 [Penicillium odoratum]KAJ5745646.1 hypothetical protein N7520_010828 [Penicillium odoratum]
MSLSNATKKISISGRSCISPHESTSEKSVTFGTNNTWIARPASASENLFESSTLLGLSQSSALANPVSFTDSTDSLSGDLTDVWELYGIHVLLTKTGANFYAKTTSEDGWYILVWSLSVKASLDYIPITLSTNAPVARS